MVKRTNDSDLISRGVDTLAVPFYQVWLELVGSKTLDVYQHRIFTSVSAIEELIEVAQKTIDGIFTNNANIQSCKEELLKTVKEDDILLLFFPNQRNRLLEILGKTTNSIPEINRLVATLRYNLKQVKPTYLERVFDELSKSIKEKDIERIERYANIIASMAVTKGWSTRALYDLMRFFTNDDCFENQWEQFKGCIVNDRKTRHTVLINFPLDHHSEEENSRMKQALEKVQLSLFSPKEICADLNDTKLADLNIKLGAEKKYFKIEVEAFDVFSAAHLALRNTADKLNMMSFFNLLGAWNLTSVTILPINMTTFYHTVFQAGDLYQTDDYLDSSGKVFDDTRAIFTDERMRSIREKLQGSFGYTNISRASLFQEEKYMTLWIALESLSRTSMYGDIISNVKETVPAAESLRYVYRIVRNFLEDCNRCNVSICHHSIEIDLKQETKQKLVKEVIEALQDQEDYEALLNRCSVNSLLKYRAECVRKLVTDIDYAISKIINHHDRVKWQIQRLYRIRNEIAHTALQEEVSLIVYIEHLYDYLSKYITEIITCLNEKGHDTLEEALCSINDNYDCFVALAKEKNKSDLLSEVLKTGVINLL